MARQGMSAVRILELAAIVVILTLLTLNPLPMVAQRSSAGQSLANPYGAFAARGTGTPSQRWQRAGATAATPSGSPVVLATVPVGDAPVQLVVNQTTNMVYVANFLSSNVTVINGATNSTSTITDPKASGPYDVAVNEQTNKIYVPNFDSGNVTVIDGATGATTTVRDSNAGCPAFAAVNSQTNMIYVTNWCSDNVTVINGATNSTTTVAVGSAPLDLAVNEVTNKIYVANQHGGNVTVIDGATNATTTVTDPNARPYAGSVAVNQQTNKIYVSNPGSNNVTAIDGATNATTTVTDPNAINPSVVAVDEVTNMIYVENGGSGPYEGSNNVTVINGATNAVITIPSGTGTDGAAVDTGLNLIYVPDWGSNSVTVINGATNTTLTLTDPNANGPNDVAVNGTTHMAYVANGGGFPFGGSNNVTVIGTMTCTGGCPTFTTLASSLNPSTYGQKVTLTATVTSTGPLPPTGTVKFTWTGNMGTFTIGAAPLNASGVATLTRSNLNADPYAITATYKGDSNNLGSSSPVLNQSVLQATSAAVMTSSLNPSVQGQSVTFTAKFTSPTAPVKGPVTFSAGPTTLGTVELSGGKAKLATSSLATGSTTVNVTYLGDSNIKGSSAAVTQVVRP
jgi:YVTN family beta-propeller protein